MEIRRLGIILRLGFVVFGLLAVTAYALFLRLIDIPLATTLIVVELTSGLFLQVTALVARRSALSGQVREALNAHYVRLSDNVFARLSNPQFMARVSDATTPFYRMEFSWDVPQIKSDPFWADAEMHLAMDIPDFRDKFEDLEGRARAYNREFVSFRASTQTWIEESLSHAGSVSEVLTEGAVLRANSVGLVEETWLSLVGKTPAQVQDQLEHIWTFLKPGKRGTDRYFGSYYVANLPSEEKTEELRKILDVIIRDNAILLQLNRFSKRKNALEEESKKVLAEVRRIVFLIQDDRYTTKVSCCKEVMRARSA